MQMCAKCKKRVAVLFITRNEGLCLKCAKDLGIKPVNDILDKMGLTESDFDRLNTDMENFMGIILAAPEEDNEEGGAPAIDFSKLIRESGLMGSSKSWQKSERETQQQKPKRKFLSTYCKNITHMAAEGQLDRIVGRERELSRIIQILCRRQKNNPCLLGEPGVGKTAIAEALAQRIVSGNVPYKLQGKEIYLVDLAALVAGTQFRGQFETRILGLLSEVKEAGNIILVIDEVHNIVGAGDAEGSMNAASIMKPALSRGEIQVIGATTLNEYRKYIEKDSALERRFQPVMVNEPSIAECIEMLRGIKQYYEDFHGIRIPDNVLRSAVLLSERYITDRYLPDKAIDLLDEAAAHLSLSTKEINEVYRLRRELMQLKAEKEASDNMPDSTPGEQELKYRQLADIKVKELQINQTLSEIEPKARAVELTHADLAYVIEIWTGIPASSINENEFERLNGLEERLKERIIGQDEAVNAVARAIRRNRAGVSYKRKPVSFIFAGPTGVGKTELVKVLSEDLFDSPETLIRLDMSEFMEKHSVSRIIGAPPGYVGYDEAGQLTEKIRRRPYSVILFDEIEKAHPDVLNILLQILDDGKITDARGKQVNFENTLIVMTTNAGSQKGAAISGFSESVDLQQKEKTERALSEFLRPEFINRVDEIITFRTLDTEDFKAIASLMLRQLAEVLSEKGITFSFTPEAAAKIAADSYSVKYGARNMRRYIQVNVEDQLAQIIITSYENPINDFTLLVSDNALKIVTA
ncbi:MAG: ATP-dependent Clp protease ATP-binding subunit [Clostridiales bacterium]|nr:ATP-dependent Clp protease ATP-binding subunit [Clostridiales bacterium]